jgi:spermidine synthase
VAPAAARLAAATGRWETALPLVALAAALLGAVFPVVSHEAIPPDARAGARVGILYLANILGSTAGSLATGYVLLDAWAFADVARALALVSVAAAAVPALARERGALRPIALAALAGVGALVALAATPLHDGLWERLQRKDKYRDGYRFRHAIENRSGVITVDEEDQIYGHGAYDGAFNTSLRRDINGIARAYAVAALHPEPREVFMLGLSSGSWAKVVADLSGVRRLTVVEINPGYLRLLPRYANVAGLLGHPRVRIEIDDARRWLVRNLGRKFDVFVANATFHWRGGATNLLSREFLELVRARLRPGGVYLFNTTNSPRTQRTAAEVFSHVLRVQNFLACSDRPLAFDREALRREIFVHPDAVLDRAREEDRRLADAVIANFDRYLEPEEALRARVAAWPLVTDDNMGTEWEDPARHPPTSTFAFPVRASR